MYVVCASFIIAKGYPVPDPKLVPALEVTVGKLFEMVTVQWVQLCGFNREMNLSPKELVEYPLH